MGVDSVNTRVNTYTPLKRRARAKLTVDGIVPADETPRSSDEETREDRGRKSGVPRPATDEDDGRGHIDEHI